MTDFEYEVFNMIKDYVLYEIDDPCTWDHVDPKDFGFDSVDELLDEAHDIAQRIQIELEPNDD